MWRTGNLFVLLVEMQIGTATVESGREIFQRIKMDLPSDTVIPLLVIHPKELKTLI